MFGRKTTNPDFNRNVPPPVVTRIELSDESRQALVGLDNDVQTLQAIMQEMVDKTTRILHALTQEITAQIPAANEEVGVQVFADFPATDELPSRMLHTPVNDVYVSEEDRIRDSPFTRAPRSLQVSWLKGVMASGDWYSAMALAREYAQDERHFRYLRHAIGGRLREMHEDHIVERRASRIKGAMYEYRLKP